jgi:hypothetical protein
MDHQSLRTCPIWELMDVAVRSLSVPVFAPGTETAQDCCGRENVPSITRSAIHG